MHQLHINSHLQIVTTCLQHLMGTIHVPIIIMEYKWQCDVNHVQQVVLPAISICRISCRVPTTQLRNRCKILPAHWILFAPTHWGVILVTLLWDTFLRKASVSKILVVNTKFTTPLLPVSMLPFVHAWLVIILQV